MDHPHETAELDTNVSLVRRALYFTGPRQVELRQEPMASPGPGEVLVQTLASAISAGTELLIFRGQAPADMPADVRLPALGGTLEFPLKYGYAAVGRVRQAGSGVDSSALGRAIFAFQPHQTHFTIRWDQAQVLADGFTPEEGLFLPNAETAVNLVHDGRPLPGEQVAVFGQGVVGLLTTALLARLALSSLVTLDRHALRRQASLDIGAHHTFDPTLDETPARLLEALQARSDYAGADLTYELSGDPTALDQAIGATGFDGRVVIGSWYGTKPTSLDLGGRFHRSRIRLISSQVSTLAPELSGRWTHSRRLRTALAFLETVRPARLITHRLPFHRAAEAYQLLAERPQEAIQVVLTYGDDA
jgi:2-desacetyl-2-hydroxyethyl bacteriochlorophyllide A dehydrogenase